MGTHPIFESDFDCLTEKRRNMATNNILFDNADENDGMPSFFVPAVAVAQTTPHIPMMAPPTQQLLQPTPPVMMVPQQTPMPTMAAPPPLFNPSSAFAQSMPSQTKKTSRYAATPGITAIGALSTPQQSMTQNASPHTYNPLPPATFVAAPTSTLTPTLTPIETHQTAAVAPQLIPQHIHHQAPAKKEVKHYWFYHTRNESTGADMWMPLSCLDSIKLEMAFENGAIEPLAICGGRYTADLMRGTRSPIYWTEDEEVRLRRGSWFASTGSGFEPLSEEACDVIDQHFRQGAFPVKFDTLDGAIVIHNHYSCVLVPPGCTPDEYGVVPEGQPRPQLVKGQIGPDDLACDIPPDEDTDEPAHALILVACGGASGKRSVNNVDMMRQRILAMKSAKYAQDAKVDILPVHWHQAHTEQAVGAAETLQPLTLGSVKRLREFTNTSMMDVLFYTSPIYAQPMVESLVTQVEDMLTLYREKNPNFNGKVAFIGHGISSLILFDLLANQGNQPAPQPTVTEEVKSVSEAGLSNTRDVASLEQLLEKLNIESIKPKLDQEQIDLDSLLMLCEDELKELSIPLGPRKKLVQYIKTEASQPSALALPSPSGGGAVPDLGELSIEEGMDVNVQYRQYDTGVGSPKISYPKLSFDPFALFGLGAPIGLLLALRGVEHLGGEFVLPTCRRFLNVFHPYDPFAYRLEPYLLDYGVAPPKPVQIPHHAGRKRLHLEIADNLGKAAEVARAGLLRSMRTVMSSVKRAAGYEEMEGDINEMMNAQQRQQRRDSEASSTKDDNIEVGSLNLGKRIDYQLQERPLEMFNEYMFAFQSHTGYWASEDVALLLLRQIYEKEPNIFISD